MAKKAKRSVKQPRAVKKTRTAKQSTRNLSLALVASHFHVYRDAVGEHRWQLVATNGKVVADSGEGYVRKVDCLNAIALVRSSAFAPVK